MDGAQEKQCGYDVRVASLLAKQDVRVRISLAAPNTVGVVLTVARQSPKLKDRVQILAPMPKKSRSFSGPGLRPFTAATGVRVPYAIPTQVLT